MRETSASPKLLRRYARAALAMDAELDWIAGGRLARAIADVQATGRDFLFSVPDLAADVIAFARRNAHTDEWVGEVADRFERADDDGSVSWGDVGHAGSLALTGTALGLADLAVGLALGATPLSTAAKVRTAWTTGHESGLLDALNTANPALPFLQAGDAYLTALHEGRTEDAARAGVHVTADGAHLIATAAGATGTGSAAFSEATSALARAESRRIPLDDMLEAAAAPDRNGLTKAGRAAQKHGSRTGSAFPETKGTLTKMNGDGIDVVDGILRDRKRVVVRRTTARYGDVVDVYARDGRGVRFGADGTMMGLLEPRGMNGEF